MLYSYINAVRDSGIEIIKFQVHIAESESSPYEQFRTKFSFEDKTRFDYWKRVSFTKDQWCQIKSYCEKLGLEFLASPFSIEAVELLEEIGVNCYKIGSAEFHDSLILHKVAKTGKPIFLSTGLSDLSEIDSTLDLLSNYNNQIVLFQCTTSYPTSPQNIGLNLIGDFIKRYNLPVGFSDHSGEIYPNLAAVVLGAQYLEFHVVFDKKMFGPDSRSSLTFHQVDELIKGVKFLDQCSLHPIEKGQQSERAELRDLFGKSLAVRWDLPSGHEITFNDLESKKPAGQGISSNEFPNVISKKLRHQLNAGDFLKTEHLINT